MPTRFFVYIDESGDEGFTFRDPPLPKGSSDWFVLTAVIVKADQDRDVRELARNLRLAIGLDAKATLHFSELNHERRVRIVRDLQGASFHCSSVIIDKRNIKQPALFQDAPFRLYFYATRLLLERVSWYCRDNGPSRQDCAAHVVFEHRRKLSYDRLKDYVDVLREMSLSDEWLRMLNHDVRIDWRAISRDRIGAAQKHQYAGLQMADIVAGSIRAAIERSNYGHTEHRFAKTVEPLIYRRSGNCLSYGLKFFPDAPQPDAPYAHWINKHYR